MRKNKRACGRDALKSRALKVSWGGVRMVFKEKLMFGVNEVQKSGLTLLVVSLLEFG